MEMKRINRLIGIFTTVTFIAMVTVNALSAALPINGVTPGEVSDSYPNLFAPAGITFSIWGLIYLMLTAYTLYQLGLFRGREKAANNALLRKTAIIFSVSSLVNIAWIFSWHYRVLPLSMLLMVLLLICLIAIRRIIYTQDISAREKLFVEIPFSVYFGWITVATIANATTLLVSLGWGGHGVSESVWTIAALMAGVMIGASVAIRFKDVAYGLVLIWAYAGILLKHLQTSGFNGTYTEVIMAVIVCIALLIVALLHVIFVRRQKNEKTQSSFPPSQDS